MSASENTRESEPIEPGSEPAPASPASASVVYRGTRPEVADGAGLRIRARLVTNWRGDSGSRSEETALCVDLLGDVCRYQRPDCDVVLDFARRQTLRLFRDQGAYCLDSLYPEVAFRVSELANRERILAALEPTQHRRYPLLPELFAHQLSLPADGERELHCSATADELRWHCDEHLLFSHSLRAHRLSPAHAREFVRFVRYHLRGHPSVLTHLQELAGLPERITWVQHGADEVQTQVLTVDGIEPSPVAGHGLEQLARRAGADDPWSVHVHETSVAGELDRRRVEQRLLRALEAAQVEGRYGEAVLLCLEYAMQNGPLPPGIDTLEPFMGDPGAQAVMACVMGQQQVTSEADARTLIRSIRALRGHFTAYKHVLMMFEAHMLTAIDELDEAEALYREILACNRYLSAVYKDLGDLFVARFAMDKAWRCWDLARQLAPQHQRLAPVERFEASLRAKHPEYF